MSNRSAANVIDFEAFRQRRLREERPAETHGLEASALPQALFVPVWFCWMPVWSPVVG